MVLRRIDRAVDTAEAFRALAGDADHAFWLDSSLVGAGGSRFSFLGVAGEDHGETLTYRMADGCVEVCDRTGIRREPGSILDALQRRLHPARPSPGLPFPLAGGYVGYLGYELKGELGSPNRHASPEPDAAWTAATRFAAVDHVARRTWLVALDDPGEEGRARRWVGEAARRLADVRSAGPPAPEGDPGPAVTPAAVAQVTADPERWLHRPRDVYLADVAACQERLRAGDSYEICLTNTAEVPFTGDGLAAYERLRRRNPAPYAAYLRLGDLQVLCSSPERFLRVGADGTVESRPIKGTIRRDEDPLADAALRDALAASPKARAENLMITDLVRNDLGRVCEIGSIAVPAFAAVESYATVHQLVSTVRGRLRPGVTAVGAVRACFPAGSMTGAPKLRTMAIIDGLEARARGVYSGAIGYFSRSGAADLNVVIRTAVLRGGRAAIGTGGAIVLDSDPVEEYEEMLLKARAPLAALTVPG